MTLHETRAEVGEIPMRQGFDHDGNAVLERDHHVEWDRLREESPVFQSDIAPEWNLWYLLRYDDLHAALQQPESFSSRHVAPYTHVEPHRWIPLELDPPEHTKYRHVLNPKFAPAAVAEMEPGIRAQAAGLVDRLASAGHCDLMADFALQFPTTIFMELMGLPVEESDTLLGWIRELMHTTPAEDPDGAIRAAAAQTIYGYLGGLIAERRARPRDDLMSHLVLSEVDGGPIPDEDLLEMCFLLYMAGLDTVAGMLGYTFKHLADHPEHRRVVTEQPEAIPAAVEELLRYYGIVTSARVVTRDTQFAGCPMKANDRIILPYAAANRDPQAFDHGDEFVIDRAPNRHVAFGVGAHRCLGSHLARAELCIAVEEWHARIPDYRIADGAEIAQHIGGVAGLHSLPLVWE